MTDTSITSNDFLVKFPSEEEMQNMIKMLESRIMTAREGEQQRMENYYNCIDDYSWGGICSKAAESSICRAKNHILKLKEQIENKKPQLYMNRVQVLTDMNNNIVSDRIVNGKFGECWIIKTTTMDGVESVSFVGKAQKASTYAKKGYKIMTIQYHIQYYWLPRECKDGTLMSVSQILSKKMVDAIEESHRHEISFPTTKVNDLTYRATNFIEFIN